MKKLVLFFISVAASFAGFTQEVTLYDTTGNKIAYIDYADESIIFSWDGKRLAYLEKVDANICIYGFNREFLGWYENDFLYNTEGFKVGTIRPPKHQSAGIEPMKGIKRISPMKPITPVMRQRKPYKWKKEWSDEKLEDFLKRGQK